MSVVRVVTVFCLAKATYSSAEESILSTAELRGSASTGTVAIDDFQEFVKDEISSNPLLIIETGICFLLKCLWSYLKYFAS